MKLTLAEQETIILFNEADAAASVYTYNGRLKARAAEYADHSRYVKIRLCFIGLQNEKTSIFASK